MAHVNSKHGKKLKKEKKKNQKYNQSSLFALSDL